MVAREVDHGYTVGYEFKDFSNHLHVRFRPIAFAELPDVNDIAVEEDLFRLDAFEVAQEFGGMAAVSAKVDVRKDYEVYIPFVHRRWQLIVFLIIKPYIHVFDKQVRKSDQGEYDCTNGYFQ